MQQECCDLCIEVNRVAVGMCAVWVLVLQAAVASRKGQADYSLTNFSGVPSLSLRWLCSVMPLGAQLLDELGWLFPFADNSEAQDRHCKHLDDCSTCHL